MKWMRLGIILVAAIGILASPACKKKSNDPQPEETPITPPAINKTFTAKINGMLTTFIISSYAINSGAIEIVGADASGNNIMLGLINSPYEGSHDIGGAAVQAAYSTVNPLAVHPAKMGKIVVTAYANNKISGTFNFTEDGGAIVITDGVFTDAPKQ